MSSCIYVPHISTTKYRICLLLLPLSIHKMCVLAKYYMKMLCSSKLPQKLWKYYIAMAHHISLFEWVCLLDHPFICEVRSVEKRRSYELIICHAEFRLSHWAAMGKGVIFGSLTIPRASMGERNWRVLKFFQRWPGMREEKQKSPWPIL